MTAATDELIIDRINHLEQICLIISRKDIVRKSLSLSLMIYSLVSRYGNYANNNIVKRIIDLNMEYMLFLAQRSSLITYAAIQKYLSSNAFDIKSLSSKDDRINVSIQAGKIILSPKNESVPEYIREMVNVLSKCITDICEDPAQSKLIDNLVEIRYRLSKIDGKDDVTTEQKLKEFVNDFKSL